MATSSTLLGQLSPKSDADAELSSPLRLPLALAGLQPLLLILLIHLHILFAGDFSSYFSLPSLCPTF